MRRVHFLRSGARKPLCLEEDAAEELARDFQLRLCEAYLRSEPDFLPALWFLGDEYARRGRYDDSLTVDLKLCALDPDNPTVRYNLGCSYARLDNQEKAIESLESAIRQGFDDRDLLISDPDLAGLRQSPEFLRLLTLLDQASQAQS